jgi:uncharacterized protein with beta-barrel porin domain
MSLLRNSVSCAALLVSAVSLGMPQALATDFVVTSGTTDNSQKTLNGADTLTVQANGTLAVAADPAVLSNNTSTGIVITNSGTIRATGTGTRAIRFLNGGSGAGATTRNFTIINNQGGVITSQNDVVNIQPNVTAGTISISNAGLMSSTGTGANNGQAVDFNNLAAGTATVIISNLATGTMSAADADGIRPGKNTVVNNSGQIIGHNAPGNTGADGVDFQTFGGTVNNFNGGSITGDRHGITGDLPVNVTNSGTITGNAGSGINLDTQPNTITTITNNGTGIITGNAVIGDGDGIDVDGQLALTNFGTIRAVGTFAGEINEGVTIGGGSIDNKAGAVITSVQRAITVDNSNLGNAFAAVTITNDGLIQGDNGEAIRITSTFANTLTNRGTITGSVVMGNGDDTVNIFSGSSISGMLDGGGGADTINLQGNGSGTLANLANFEVLNVQSGSWTIPDTQTYSTGATVFNGATLIVNGSLNNPVSVNAGGLLGGVGTVGSLAVSGTVAPGNSIGTMTVTGNATFQTGSTYQVEANAAGQADRINAASATINGGTVQVLAQGGSYAPSTNYIILSTTGARSGQFTSVTSNLAFLNPSLSYSTNAVTLTLVRNATFFQQVAQTTNQANVAAALDHAPSNSPPFLAVVGLNPSGAQQAFDALSGIIATGTAQAGIRLVNGFLPLMLDPSINDRGSDASGGSPLSFASENPKRRKAASAFASIKPIAKAPERQWSTWAAAYGGQADYNGDAVIGSRSLNIRTGGAAAGLDYRLAPDSLVGLALAGGSTTFGVADGFGTGRSDTFMAGLYGMTRYQALYVSAAMAFASHRASTDRFATIGGTTDHLTANFTAQSLGGRLESGYRFNQSGLALTPYAALQTQTFYTPAYSEVDVTGLTAFALSYGAQHTTDTRSELGSWIEKDIASTAEAPVTLRGRIAWLHQFSPQSSISAVFQTAPAAGFVVNGATPSRDAALLSAAADLRIAKSVMLTAKFDGEFANGSRSYVGTGAVRTVW